MGAEVLHVDRHDEDNNSFSQFREKAWKIVGDLVIIKYAWHLFGSSEFVYILEKQVHSWTRFVPKNFYHFYDGDVTDGKLYI
jgi:hypothetical protein